MCLTPLSLRWRACARRESTATRRRVCAKARELARQEQARLDCGARHKAAQPNASSARERFPRSTATERARSDACAANDADGRRRAAHRGEARAVPQKATVAKSRYAPGNVFVDQLNQFVRAECETTRNADEFFVDRLTAVGLRRHKIQKSFGINHNRLGSTKDIVCERHLGAIVVARKQLLKISIVHNKKGVCHLFVAILGLGFSLVIEKSTSRQRPRRVDDAAHGAGSHADHRHRRHQSGHRAAGPARWRRRGRSPWRHEAWRRVSC